MAKSQEPSDAIELLMQDHRKVEELFAQFEKVAEDDEEAATLIIEELCTELSVHDRLEMEVFYPAVRDAAEEEDVEDLLDEAEVEHEGVRELIEKIEGMADDDQKRNARVMVLSEYVKHHVKEEETEMFPKVKKLKSLDLKALGDQMADMKAELIAELAAE